jgi:ABC-2 type transport system permease protein
MRRYWRVWRAFAASCLARELGYRASFLMGALRDLLWLGLALINIEIIYSYTDSIAGWSKAQMWLLLGIAGLTRNLIAFAFRPNIERISSYIEYGDMDYILLKPISSQFTATLRYVDIHELPPALVNVGLIAYALDQIGRRPTWLEIAAFALMFLAGLLILYSIWLALATLAFWLIRQASNISELFDSLMNATRYPTHIFPPFLQFILIYIVPLAFATTFPAQTLSGKPDGWLLLLALLLAGGALYLSHRFWLLATRYYSSASS